MIARPDWLRRKYIFAGALIAIGFGVMIWLGDANATRKSANLAADLPPAPPRDPWQPYRTPVVVVEVRVKSVER